MKKILLPFTIIGRFLLRFFYLVGHPLYLLGLFLGKSLLSSLFLFRPFLLFLGKRIVILLVTFTLFLISFWFFILKDLPSPNKLNQRFLPLSTKIYDRKGRLLYKIYRHQNRTLIPLDDLPPFLIQATVAAEDKEFWRHRGISLRGIVRALVHNLSHPHHSLMGGSTITQQLVKNALLTPEKTWRRKLKEMILALWVETKFSKKEILQMYLNEVPYGGTAYGIEEAAQKYFGKSARELNPAEAALLAGLPAAPTRYSPFGAYPQLAKKRQKQVLEEMVKAGYLFPEQAAQIAKTPLYFSFQANHLKAPHFVFYVKDLLVEEYGQNLVEQGGLVVTTTLDLELQEKAEKILREELEKIKNLHVTNGAILIIHPPTGEILAMVGSKDYFDFQNQGNVNVVLSPRQPGSTIKVVNYAVALQKGFTPATILSDTPVTFRLSRWQTYSPKNYDRKFHGKVPLRVAFASSLNVPAVKVLAAVGVEEMVKMGKKMGITTWDNSQRFGLSLTLGGGEVKMIDLAQVYSVLANLGVKVPLKAILKVQQPQKALDFPSSPSQEVLDPGVAFLINDILSDNKARTLGFGPHSLLNIPNKTVAVKTGTSNNLRDNWAIGYTPQFLVAVWVGNNDNSPMSKIASGITGATPIWRRLTDYLLTQYPQTGWPKPKNVVSLAICRPTGTLPCQGCPLIENEYFLTSFLPKTACRSEWFSPNQPPKTSKSSLSSL